MSELTSDLRYGLRNLLRAPAFTTAAVLALGLGIGTTTAIFSIVHGVVLQPLPYDEPDRLVTIWDANQDKALDHEPISPVNFLDYRGLTQVFEDAAAWWRPQVTLNEPGHEPLRVNTIEASGNFLSVLRVRPSIGPGFPAGVLNAPERLVLVSHRLWRSRFDSDPSLAGRTIRLNDSVYTVAGVMAAGFNYPADTDVWERLNWNLAQHSRGAHFMESVARLAPGASIAQAQRELDALTTRLGTEFTGTNRGWRARAISLHQEIVGSVRPALYILFAAVGLLLLIACINVASLLLARAASRAREVAVRAAIGATRQRLLRQFLTESLLLAGAGAVTGVLLAVFALKAVIAGSAIGIAAAYVAARQIGSVLYGVTPGDPVTLGGVATVALAVAGVACAAPAWRASRMNPLAGLKE